MAQMTQLFGTPLCWICPDVYSLPGPLTEILVLLWEGAPSRVEVFGSQCIPNNMKSIKEQLNRGLDVDLEVQSLDMLVALLRSFLMELPGSLLVYKWYKEWINALETKDERERISRMTSLVDRLPVGNRLLLRCLLSVLLHILETNCMDAYNLAVCIGPILLLEDVFVLRIQREHSKMVDLTKFLIVHSSEIFGENLVNLLDNSDLQIPAPEDFLVSPPEDVQDSPPEVPVTIEGQSSSPQRKRRFPYLGGTGYIVTALQSLLTMKSFVREVKRNTAVWTSAPEAKLFRQLVNYAKSRHSRNEDVRQDILRWMVSEFGDNSQQDAHVFLGRVLEQMRFLAPKLQERAAGMGCTYTCPVQAHLTFELKTTWTCKTCDNNHLKVEEATSLSLDLKPGDTVDRALQRHLMETEVKYDCQCGAKNAFQKRVIRTMRSVLILHLKHKVTSSCFSKKVKKQRVTLNEDFVLGKGKERRRYTMRSVLSHMGPTPDSGHYISEWEADDQTDHWLAYDGHNFDDTTSNTVRHQRQRDAYIIFYQQDELGDEAGYIDAALQSLLTMKSFIREVNRNAAVWRSAPEAELFRQLMYLAAYRHSRDEDDRQDVLKWMVSEFWEYRQNDAHVFLGRVLEQMRSLAPKLQERAAYMGCTYTCPVQAHLTLKLRTTWICKTCDSMSLKMEEATSLSLDLEPGNTVCWALKQHLMETEVKRPCGCGAKKAFQKRSILTPPSVLILQLNRKVTSFCFFKKVRKQGVTLNEAIRLVNEESKVHYPYTMRSVLSHMGPTPDSGHYISEWEADDQTDRWLAYDGHNFYNTTSNTVSHQQQRDAYIVFYQQDKLGDEAGYIDAALQSLLTMKSFIREVNRNAAVWRSAPEAELFRQLVNYAESRHSRDEDDRQDVLRWMVSEFGDNSQQDAHVFLGHVLEQMRFLAPNLQERAASMGCTYTCPVQAHLTLELQTTWTCKTYKCDKKSLRVEKVTSLSLDLDLDLKPGDTVDQALQRHLMETEVKRPCGCGAKKAFQKRSFLTTPSVLILHLKHKVTSSCFSKKVKKQRVTLNEEFLLDDGKERRRYTMRSVLSQTGPTPDSGDYISEWEADDQTDHWLAYDGHNFKDTTSKKVRRQRQRDAYIVFYQQDAFDLQP